MDVFKSKTNIQYQLNKFVFTRHREMITYLYLQRYNVFFFIIIMLSRIFLWFLQSPAECLPHLYLEADALSRQLILVNFADFFSS